MAQLTAFQQRARRGDPNGYLVVQEMLDELAAAHDAAINKPFQYGRYLGMSATWPIVTPQDGDVFDLAVLDPVGGSTGIVWRFRYNAGSGFTWKWEFVGGPPYVSPAAATVTTAAAPFVDYAISLFNILKTGLYEIAVGGGLQNNVAGVGNMAMSAAFHGNNNQIGYALRLIANNANEYIEAMGTPSYVSCNASQIVKLQVGNYNSTSAIYYNGILSIRPIRVEP
jgi:hypothetical protein